VRGLVQEVFLVTKKTKK